MKQAAGDGAVTTIGESALTGPRDAPPGLSGYPQPGWPHSHAWVS